MNPYSRQSIYPDDIQAVVDVLHSSLLTQGEQTELFEAEIAQYVGAKYALACNSATSALYCAYRAAGLGGSEVVTSPISFVATSNMLLEVGAKPVFCDIKSDGNIDESKINLLLNPQSKAIVSIDFGGKSVEAETIHSIAKDRDLIWISDSSHSFGAEYKGKKIGSLADISIFSFHALKPFTTGEGGALVTDNEDIYLQAKLIRSHGVMKQTLWNSDVKQSGFNFRITEFASALGRSQLKKVDDFIAQREKIANFYDATFTGNIHFDILPIPKHLRSSRHLYSIFLKPQLWCAKEEIFTQLTQAGLGVQVHYKPIHLFSLYQPLAKTPLYNAERFYKAQLSIPCHQKMTLEEAQSTAQTLLKIFSQF